METYTLITDIRQVIIAFLLMLGRGEKMPCLAFAQKNLSCPRADVWNMSEWKQALMINQGGKICPLQMPSVPLIKSLLRNTDFITGEMLLCTEISHFTPLTSAINLATPREPAVFWHFCFGSYWRRHHLRKSLARSIQAAALSSLLFVSPWFAVHGSLFFFFNSSRPNKARFQRLVMGVGHNHRHHEQFSSVLLIHQWFRTGGRRKRRCGSLCNNNHLAQRFHKNSLGTIPLCAIEIWSDSVDDMSPWASVPSSTHAEY